jgi:hypothetical protein
VKDDVVIEIDEIERQGRFSATLLDGTVLVASSRQPMLDTMGKVLEVKTFCPRQGCC